MNKAIAIISDVESSGILAKQNIDYIDVLESALNYVNTHYKEEIILPFEIYNGDEFQGLLKHTSNFLEIIYEIEKRFFPLKFNTGIGIGNVTQDISTFKSSGECYFSARDALEEVKQNRKALKRVDTNKKIISNIISAESLDIINSLLSTLFVIKDSWSEKQNNIISLIEELDTTQIQVAEKLDINPSSVTRSLESSSYYTYKNSLKTLDNFIRRSLNG